MNSMHAMTTDEAMIGLRSLTSATPTMRRALESIVALRAVVDALPKCAECHSIATREFFNAPAWDLACDDPEHVPSDRNGYPVRDLRYARALRALKVTP